MNLYRQKDYLSPELIRIINKYEPVDHKQEKEFVKNKQYELLVYHNLRYACKRALEMVGGQLCPYPADVCQQAFMGMWKATKTFDPNKEVKFITWADFYIRTEITKWVASNDWSCTVSMDTLQRARKIRVYADKHNCSFEKAAKFLKQPPKALHLANLNKKYSDISLHDDGDGKKDAFRMDWDDNLPTDNQQAEHNIWEDLSRYKYIQKLFEKNNISERNQSIIRLRFGIDSGEPMDLIEVGKIFNLGRERIRQIVNEACEKIKCGEPTPEELKQ